jgi:uncharacterized protein YjbI with pentapeptide repeats
MAKSLEIISEQDLDNVIGNRISLNHKAPQKVVNGKIINYPIEMMRRQIIHSNTYLTDLIFTGCTFNDVVKIGTIESAGNVEFINCIFNSKVTIQYQTMSFSEDCIFNSDLHIELSNSHNSGVEISKLNVEGTLELTGRVELLSVTKINLNSQAARKQKLLFRVEVGELEISNVLNTALLFNNSCAFSGIGIIRDVLNSEINFGGIAIDTGIEIFNSNVTNLKISNTRGVSRRFSLFESTIAKMEANIGNLDKLSIIGGSFENLNLVENNNKESIINIEKVSIFNLKFEKLYNNGLITLRELFVPKDGVLVINSSNLGKTDFINCNFSKALLEFQNSKITECFFSETDFPKKVIVNGMENDGQAQLAFGQLSTAFQKQGDTIRALEYSSREVEAHYRKTRWFSKDFFHKLNLFLNWISNNFGRNWIRGVLFSFSIGLLMFCLLLVSTDKFKWGYPSLDFTLLPSYLKFMNPLRFFELEDLFKNSSAEGAIKLNGLSYLADFGGRILIAYGYYQTIQAFRRYGRK